MIGAFGDVVFEVTDKKYRLFMILNGLERQDGTITTSLEGNQSQNSMVQD
ncbi:hypothetical protein LR68_03878 [Anoxybacillus sp. BCO1]|nr:hypothetical protein LR68_03878 [Anoxybacillus sp. BCO1]